MLLANVFARSEAVRETVEEVKAEGTPEAPVPDRVFGGDRTSNTIIAEYLAPVVLGTLAELQEHSALTQSVIWGINSFDHCGVELDKALVQRIMPELESKTEPELKHDGSINSLVRCYRRPKGTRQ
jgi:glucose-6-phosphate isomerase